MKRVWAVHEALLSFRLQDASSLELRQLLLGAVASPVFLHCPDGLRFLVFVFSLSPSFVKPLHDAIKLKMPSASKQVQTAFADLYLKVNAI